MPRTYSRAFQVRHYELDSLGHVNNAVYLNYLQQIATEASADAGYDVARYNELGAMWLVRKNIIEYDSPAVYGDVLQATTWVSDFKQVQSHREYRLVHAQTGQSVVRARTNWAFLDKNSQRLKRIPPEMIAAFDPWPEIAVRDLEPGRGEQPTVNARRYLSHRRVQHYELDSAQHVNNAVYLNWVEQAFFDACATAGFGAATMFKQTGVTIVTRRNELEYFLPAVADDEIEITSWVNSMARTHGTWVHEMRRISDGKLLLRAYATGAFLNGAGRPTRLAPAYQQAILGQK